MSFSAKSIQSHFPIFKHRPELVYLDNAATTQKPDSVIQTMTDFYEQGNSNIHRGLYDLSTMATSRFEAVRTKVAGLIGATHPSSIAFTKGTTESINIIAHGFLRKQLKKGDNVVISAMEHHANLIPWQQICARQQAALHIIPVNNLGELILDNLDSLLNSRTRLVALTHISNVLGTINPIDEIIAAARARQIPVLIDAAQSVGHYPLHVADSDIDFLVFSAHKMFGPLGTGVLYSKPEFTSFIDPLNFGGGGIRNVTFEKTDFMEYPYSLEAGTAHIPGVIGLGTAIDFVQNLNINEVVAHEKNLSIGFKEKARALGDIQLVGEPKNFSGIVSFLMNDIHPHDVAGFLANENIAVRAGHHCAQPLLEHMGMQATVRVSFTIYNTREDVDKIISALGDLKKFWSSNE
jgi:cysteine desulfurase/selenocysteine lyase